MGFLLSCSALQRWLRWPVVVLGCLLSSGCIEWGYYQQAVSGQWHLLSQRRDIDAVITASATSETLRERLELVLQIRDFASRELLLPDNRSYRSYADLGRPYAVWNVVATPELSLDPVTWCFPVVGCVPYRGYFDQDAAHRFASTMRDQGYDVQLNGVAAYSTLNWFDDPVLNTFIHYPEAELAGLLFHELAHQQLYLKGDATFNESFATAVEKVGVARWLAARGEVEGLAEYAEKHEQYEQFIVLLLTTRQQLQTLYQGSTAAADQRLAKAAIIEQFRRDCETLKQQWEASRPFALRLDRWIDQPLNNAHFALVATYHKAVPAFYHLLKQYDNDLQQFYAAAAELAGQPPVERQQILDSLIKEEQNGE